MVQYKCEGCGKSFSHKGNYHNHVNRKNKCTDDLIHKCEGCNKRFSSRTTLWRHKKKCSFAKIIIEKQYIEKQNIQNNNLNVDGDVKVVKFGDENLDYISDDLYKHILGRGFKAVGEFIEHSHFNSDHPENHNIYIANIKDDYVIVYDGNKWIIDKKDTVMEDIIYAKSDFLNLKFQELMGEMNERDVKKFNRFIDERDDDKTLNKLKDEIKLQLYNNRHMPQNLRRQIETSNRSIKRIKNKPEAKKTLESISKLLTDPTEDNIYIARQLLANLQ